MSGVQPITVPEWRGELGLEPTVELFIAHIVSIFREVWRVLRDDGTLWLNFGDSYFGGGYSNQKINSESWNKTVGDHRRTRQQDLINANQHLKPKDLIGIPWRVAFALQADGWYLRSDIIWHKPSTMPESVTDRCTKSHEYLFLLAKNQHYYCDMEAIKEKAVNNNGGNIGSVEQVGTMRRDIGRKRPPNTTTRNKRDVWSINTHGYSGAHFATFPPALVEPCIKAGTSEYVCPTCGAPWERVVEKTVSEAKQKRGYTESCTMRNDGDRPGTYINGSSITTGWRPTCDCPGPDGDHPGSDCADYEEWPTVPATVLDPFCGSGTTGLVAKDLHRRSVLLDISHEYLYTHAKKRAEGISHIEITDDNGDKQLVSKQQLTLF